MMGNLLRLIMRGTRKVVRQPDEALLLCRMAWWIVVLSIAARLYSLPRALQLVAGNPRPTPNSSPLNQEKLAQLIDLLLSADVLVFKPICWKRAAVLHRYLLKRGVETQIIFGVRNDPKGKIDGHAWLEFEGKPILEKTPPQYVVTYSFPSSQPFNTHLATLSHE
jgi:hypothetical protein